MGLALIPFAAPQDGQAMLWDLNEGKHLYTLDGGDIINALCFSPNRYWLCAATGPSIKIWVRGSLIFIPPPRPDPCGIPPKKPYFCQTWGFAGFGATFAVQTVALPHRSQTRSSGSARTGQTAAAGGPVPVPCSRRVARGCGGKPPACCDET